MWYITKYWMKLNDTHVFGDGWKFIAFDPHLLAEWVVVDVDVDSRAQVELLEKQVLSQSSLGGKMDALTVQVATQAMVGAKVEAAGLQLMKRTMA